MSTIDSILNYEMLSYKTRQADEEFEKAFSLCKISSRLEENLPNNNNNSNGNEIPKSSYRDRNENKGRDTRISAAVRNNTTIEKLDDDCLIQIFTYLTISDRIRLERVCKRWRDISLMSWCHGKILNLFQASWGKFDDDVNNNNDDSDDIFLPRRWSHCKINSKILYKVLSKCGSYIRTLRFDVDRNNIPGDNEIKFKNVYLQLIIKLCPNVRSINLSLVVMSSFAMTMLADGYSNVRELTLGQTSDNVDKALIQLFRNNGNLRYLKINSNRYIGGECLLHLPKESMEVLILKCAVKNATHLIRALPDLKKLHTIEMKNINSVNEDLIDAISLCKDLMCLRLTLFNSINNLTNLSRLHNLKELKVDYSDTSIDDNFLKSIGNNCKKLSTVSMEACNQVSDRGLFYITSLKDLQYLCVKHLTKITDKSFLADMPNLKTLKCSDCPRLGNHGLTHLLKNCANLVHLDVGNCKRITNALIKTAIEVTKNRVNDNNNNSVLKIYISGSGIKRKGLKNVSPLLKLPKTNPDRTYKTVQLVNFTDTDETIDDIVQINCKDEENDDCDSVDNLNNSDL